jgi:peptidoglycan/xylan/chitin deacetylase (PgdA/CDA1 family)
VAAAGVALVALIAVLLASGSGQRASGRRASARHSSASSHTATHHSSKPSLSAREDAAINRLLARESFITGGGFERREIALTFDDGPGPYTPRLLDELQRLRLHATFFIVGTLVHYFHASLTREIQLGEAIGDHTERHPMMALLPPAAQDDQIVTQTEWLHRYHAPFPRLYRPPYGSFNRATFAILHRLHMLMVLWTVDTSDYLQPGVATLVSRVLAGARPGAIILMHDAGGTRTQTIEALPAIVHALRRRRYRLVTVPRLILDDPPLRRQVLPAGLAAG